jgi:uncharacterized protein
MKHILNSEQIVSNWSGGSTKQIYIYPENASLAERDFDFRISSAKVDIESSNFTKFEGYQRILMVLQGELQINHEGHHTRHLKTFEQDTFSGSWETNSKGKVVDFNLIFKPTYSCQLSYHPLKRNQQFQIKKKANNYVGIYIYSGLIAFKQHEKTIELKPGDCVILENEAHSFTSLENATDLIFFQIS